MKISSILKATAAFAAIIATSASVAAPIYTMTDAIATSTLKVSGGCKPVSLGGLADVTFEDDGTYILQREIAELPDPLIGTWVEPTIGKVFMAANNDNPSPFEDPRVPGSMHDLFNAIDTVIQANCALNPKIAGNTVVLVRPSVLITKNDMMIKVNKDGSKTGTLKFNLKGAQTNAFKGSPASGTFSATITVTGIVTEAVVPVTM